MPCRSHFFGFPFFILDTVSNVPAVDLDTVSNDRRSIDLPGRQ
jgi:hypothetical protein